LPTSPDPSLITADPRLRRTALALAGITLLSRLPFAARRLWDHDSIQFALGVEKYNPAAHHPHPPGYPLYIGILKVLAALGIPPQHAMVGLAILGGVLGSALLFLLTARLTRVGEEGSAERREAAWRAGLFAGAIYAFNPLLWFYGELQLTYALEGGLAVAIAYGALRMADSRRAFLLACVVFPLAGGLRQSTMILLTPLFLYGVFLTWRRGRLTWKLLFGGGLLSVAITLAWFIPLCVACGGYAEYRRISQEHYGQLLPYTSILYGGGWPALRHNVEVLIKWAVQGILPGAVALGLAWILAPGRILPGLRHLISRLDWVAVWAVPPVLFFALFHITKAGYTLVHLPALLLALALAAAPALAASRPRALAAVGLAALAGIWLFVFGADRRPEQSRLWFPVRNELNQGTIRAYERDLDRMLAAVRRYPPGQTVLATIELEGTGAAGAEGFLFPWHRHLQWYLPEYPVVMLVPDQGFSLTVRGHRPLEKVVGPVPVPLGTRRVLFVLSGPLEGRYALPLGEVLVGQGDFLVTAVPFRGALRVGPLEMRSGAGQEERVAQGTPFGRDKSRPYNLAQPDSISGARGTTARSRS
jgi:hypothetical protein